MGTIHRTSLVIFLQSEGRRFLLDPASGYDQEDLV